MAALSNLPYSGNFSQTDTFVNLCKSLRINVCSSYFHDFKFLRAPCVLNQDGWQLVQNMCASA